VLLELRRELGLWNRAQHLIDDLAVLEEENQRDRANAEALREALILIYVNLCNLCLAGIFTGELLEDRTDHAARPAPGSPEVHHCEAIVLLDKSLNRRFGARLKHGGQFVSKARFLAAPWIGMLESGAWRARAAHANAMAEQLAGAMPFEITHPVQTNAVFVAMDDAALTRLREAGWFAYRFIDGSVRFMCSWATTPTAVDELGEVLKAFV